MHRGHTTLRTRQINNKYARALHTHEGKKSQLVTQIGRLRARARKVEALSLYRRRRVISPRLSVHQVACSSARRNGKLSSLTLRGCAHTLRVRSRDKSHKQAEPLQLRARQERHPLVPVNLYSLVIFFFQCLCVCVRGFVLCEEEIRKRVVLMDRGGILCWLTRDMRDLPYFHKSQSFAAMAPRVQRSYVNFGRSEQADSLDVAMVIILSDLYFMGVKGFADWFLRWKGLDV